MSIIKIHGKVTNTVFLAIKLILLPNLRCWCKATKCKQYKIYLASRARCLNVLIIEEFGVNVGGIFGVQFDLLLFPQYFGISHFNTALNFLGDLVD
jgi:hypothetical protein